MRLNERYKPTPSFRTKIKIWLILSAVIACVGCSERVAVRFLDQSDRRIPRSEATCLPEGFVGVSETFLDEKAADEILCESSLNYLKAQLDICQSR